MKLLINALVKYLAGLALVSALLFLPAGTADYLNGWLFLALLFLPVLALGVLLYCKAPALLEKRLSAKEKQGEQRGVIALSGLLFLAGFLLCGFDFRFGWSSLPAPVVAGASLVFLLSYGLYARVMGENAWLSRTVEVQAGQRVVDTGPYAIVRHPMYTAALGLFLSMPLVLGSLWAFLLFLAYPALLVRRIRGEEGLLREELEGYKDYVNRVPYRLIPYIW